MKALTAMQIGISVGALSNLHLVVTAAAGLVICMAVLALFRAKGYAQSTLVLVFALLVLCYMASLLAVCWGSIPTINRFSANARWSARTRNRSAAVHHAGLHRS